MLKSNCFNKNKYVISCVFSYGVDNAFKYSKNKEVFIELAETYKCKCEDVPKVILKYCTFEKKANEGISLVGMEELKPLSTLFRGVRILKQALVEFKMNELYSSLNAVVLESFTNNSVDKNSLISLMDIQKVMQDIELPYFDTKEMKLCVPALLDPGQLFLGIVLPTSGPINSIFVPMLEQLALSRIPYSIYSTELTYLSDFIAMIEYCGLRLCDILPNLINPDITPMSKFVPALADGIPNTMCLYDLEDDNNLFMCSKNAYMQAHTLGVVNKLHMVDGVLYVDNVEAFKYLGVK